MNLDQFELYITLLTTVTFTTDNYVFIRHYIIIIFAFIYLLDRGRKWLTYLSIFDSFGNVACS